MSVSALLLLVCWQTDRPTKNSPFSVVMMMMMVMVVVTGYSLSRVFTVGRSVPNGSSARRREYISFSLSLFLPSSRRQAAEFCLSGIIMAGRQRRGIIVAEQTGGHFSQFSGSSSPDDNGADEWCERRRRTVAKTKIGKDKRQQSNSKIILNI